MNEPKKTEPSPTPQLASQLVAGADELMERVIAGLLERSRRVGRPLNLTGPIESLVSIAAAGAVYLRELAMAQSVLAQLEVAQAEGEDEWDDDEPPAPGAPGATVFGVELHELHDFLRSMIGQGCPSLEVLDGWTDDERSAAEMWATAKADGVPLKVPRVLESYVAQQKEEGP